MSFLNSLFALLRGSSGSTLSPDQVKEMMEAPASARPVLIDVRTPREWKDGHIRNARHADISDDDFAGKVGSFSRDGKYVLYCLSGGRSGYALSVMRSMGFHDVSHLRGGIGAWKSAGLPVVK